MTEQRVADAQPQWRRVYLNEPVPEGDDVVVGYRVRRGAASCYMMARDSTDEELVDGRMSWLRLPALPQPPKEAE